VSAKVEEVEHLIGASIDDISRTDEVIDTIQSISGNTQMLGLNASIEAAHAREHGQGFSIVAEAVRKLSVQCGDAAESVKATQTHLHESMRRVVDCSRNLMADTQEQTKATGDIARMVAELKRVSEALMAMTRA
jgi:methyl-accepting chemotaxis protein